MAQKRALIVDDSRSARVILGRMLEGYALQVDSSESAELALEYLRQTKPDVIFMDHLMPGMDGFQAIQAIKSDPGTATIPVVMYTSQEGELYVSQARALGAVGVLPKTVKQADVSRVLHQLRLLPERRDTNLPPAKARDVGDLDMRHEDNTVEITQPSVVSSREFETAIRAALAPALKEQSLELRRFFAAGMEAFARRLGEGRAASAEGKVQGAPPPAVELLPIPEPTPPPPAIQWPLVAGIAALALLPSLILGVMFVRNADATQSLLRANARLTAIMEEQQSQLASLQKANVAAQQAASTAAAPSTDVVEPVPYGETPLAGARLERLRDLIEKLKAQSFRGKVKVVTYVGEFCLTGNGIEGYSVAADELPLKRCDLVGNPFEDGLGTSQRQSLAFANLLATVRQQAADGLTIEVSHAGRRPATTYPEGDRLAKGTAGEWNRIAAQNNRVEFAVEAAS
jgi:CheY-like chemotaxis protein